MQWIVGYGPELHLVVIYIGYWSVVDFLQWNVESTSKLNSKKASTPVVPNGSCSKLIYHDDTFYEGCIGSRFILVHRSILVITHGYPKDNEQSLGIGLID